jgi:Ca2+-binding RTX toxin-like protein
MAANTYSEQQDLAIFNTIIPIPIFLNNNVTGTKADDFMYGDLTNLKITVKASVDTLASLTSPLSIALGNDSLSGGAGNDWIVGDVKNLVINVESGTANTLPSYALLANLNIQTGSDTLNGGTGDDSLFGDVEKMTIQAVGGVGNGSFADAYMAQNTFSFGHDTLIGDVGNDLLVGDVGTLEISALGGVGNASGIIQSLTSFPQGNIFTFGSDNLNGGVGNDTLIGDVKLMTLTLKAGTGSLDSQFANSQFINNVITFGNDTLKGDNGLDLLVGDVQTLNISAVGGTANAGYANALLISSPLTFGNDTLDGENDNDILIGDVQSLNISMIDGTITDAGLQANAAIYSTTITFGNDTLTGGNGDDLLIGDIQTMTLFIDAHNGLLPMNLNTIILGSDLLVGGNGNDTLYADLVNPGQLSAFLDIQFGNTLVGGNDVLQGGAGNDKLYAGWGVDLLQGQEGDDILTGGMGTAFMQGGAGNDTLQGGAGLDIADYSDATSGVTVNLGLTGPQNVGGGLGKDTLIAIDGLIGSKFNDTLTGTNNNDTFYASGGVDTIKGLGGSDILSFAKITHTLASTQNVAIPAVYGQVYHDLQVELGNPSWLPTPPTTININGVSITGGATQAIHGDGTTNFQSIEGFAGTQFNDYMVMDSTYLTNPNAGPAGSGGPGVLLSGEGGSDVLVGTSKDDVIMGGRIDPSYISAGAGNDLIQIGQNLDEGLINPSPAYPFGIPNDATPNNYGTPLFNIVYAGNGDDTVWAYCSEVGLSLVYMGDGNDTFNDYCVKCSNVVYGGAGNDTFKLQCFENLERMYGEDGDDIIQSSYININDIFSGGNGNDSIYVTQQALGGRVEGGSGFDVIQVLNAFGTTIEGGADADSIYVTGDNVTLSYASSTAGVNVNLANLTSSGGDAEGDYIESFFVTNGNLIGSAFDDTLRGDSSNNILTGGNGADTFVFNLIMNDGHDTITDLQGIDFLKFRVNDVNNDNIIDVQDVLAQSHVVNNAGHAQLVFDNGASIDFLNVNYTGQTTLTDIVPANHIEFISAPNFISFIGYSQVPTMQTFNIPAIYGQTYHGLQVELGNPAWLPTPPTTMDINGVVIDVAAGQAQHGSDVINFNNTSGFQGTQFNDYIVVDATYLANPDAGPAGSGGPGTLLSGDGGMDVLVGGSGDDVIMGGRIDPNYISAGAGNDLIQIGENLSEGLTNPSDNYPFGVPYDATPNNYGTPLFNLVYAGTGDDTVWAYCSEVGLSLVYLGDGNDTFNDYCIKCSNVVYGGAGNDVFKILCLENLERLYGEDGNDTFQNSYININDILSGGNGNDSITITQALGGKIEGGADADYIYVGSGSNVTLSYESSAAGVNVDLANLGSSGGDAEGDSLNIFATNTNLLGSAYDDTLRGDTTNNILTGGNGADTFVFNLAANDGHDTITDLQAMDKLKFLNTDDVNHDSSINILDVLAQSHIVNNGGHAQAVFDNGATIDFLNVNYTGQSSITDVVSANQIELAESPDFLSFIGYSQVPTMQTFNIPAIYGQTYHNLQVELGNPSWLPNPPTTMDINGVVIDVATEQAHHGSDVINFHSIEGFQGTQFNDYIVVDATYLANPNAGPAGSGGPGFLLSGDSGMDVLVGGSGDDVIMGGRIDPNYISAGAGNDMIQIGENLSEGLHNPTDIYPFGIPNDATPNNYGTPLFNLVYAGTGDDTVWAYCSEVGLSLVYMGDGNDTFNDYCIKCSNVVYGGAGNDTFVIKCLDNLERLYGEDGNDTFQNLYININDILSGGNGNDTISITSQAYGGKIEGGADADIISVVTGDNVTLSYELSSAGVNVNLAAHTASGGDAQGDNISNFNVNNANLLGSAFNDTLRGDSTNNILTGGNGADTFVFNLAANDGHDTIKDLQATDFLMFINTQDVNNDSVINAQDVMAQSHVVNNAGHAQAVFNNGATIDFVNVTYTSQTTLADILPTNHLVII